MHRIGRHGLGLVVWLILFLLALVGSLLIHIQLPLGRRVVRNIVNRYVSSQMVGTLHIGRIDYIGLDAIVARHTEVLDPNGVRVIYGDRVDLVIDYEAAMNGVLRFSHARLRHGYLRLIDDGEGIPTFIDGFGAADPTPSEGPPFHAIVDDMHLEDVTAYGEVLGLQGLRVVDLRVHGRLESEEELEIKIWSATGRVVAPFPFEAHLDDVVTTISTDDLAGTRLYARAHRGDEEVEVDLTYALPEGSAPEDPYELDLLIHANPVHTETLREVGFEWAESLTGTGRGHVRLHGPPNDLRLRARLDTDGGEVRLVGELPSDGDVVVVARGERWRADRILDGLPAVDVGGEVTLRQESGEEGRTLLDLRLEPFVYEDFPVPTLAVRAEIVEDAVVLRSVSAPGLAGHLAGSGRIGFDGEIDVYLRGHIADIGRDARVSTLLPGSRGSLTFDLHVRQNADEEVIRANGQLRFAGLRYAGVEARALAIDGRLWGDLARPNVDVDLRADALAVSGYAVGTGTGTFSGGPSRYALNAAFRGEAERLIEIGANIGVGEDDYRVDVPRFRMSGNGLDWQGLAEGIHYRPDRLLEVGSIRLASRDQTLEAHGAWSASGDDAMSLSIRDLDLVTLPAILGSDTAPEITGRGDLHVEVAGDLEGAPQVQLEANLRDGAYLGVERLFSAAVIRYDGGSLAMEGHLSAIDQGTLTLQGTGMIDAALPLEQALREGYYDLELATEDLELAVLRLLAPELEVPLDGRLNGVVHASGVMDSPTFEGQINVPNLEVPAWSPLEVTARFDYSYGALITRLLTRDEHGELVEVEASLLMDLVQLARDPDLAYATLETSPWRLSLRLPSRRVGTLPDTLLEGLPQGVRDLQVMASLNLAGGAFETHGTLDASVELTSDLSREVCGRDAWPRAQIVADLRHGESVLDVQTHVGGRRVLHVVAAAATPLDDWIHGRTGLALPPVNVEAAFDDAPLGDIPVACSYAGGALTGRLSVAGLFGPDPIADLELESDHFRARWLQPGTSWRSGDALISETPPIGLSLMAHAGGGLVLLGTNLAWWNGGGTTIDGAIPIQWDAATPIPELDEEGELEARVTLTDMPLEAAMAWAPGMSASSGVIDGTILVLGEFQHPSLSGQVQLSDGRVELHALGQRLRAVQGRILFDEDGMLLRGITARDDDGSVAIDGEIELVGLSPRVGRLRLAAERFPIRAEGSVMARLTGDARLQAKFLEDGMTGGLDVLSLDVRLPEDLGTTPQALEGHPDIHIVNLPPPAEELALPYGLEMEVIAPSFSVTRSDFNADVSADLAVTYSDPDFRVKGSVSIQGGFFEVFGRRFDVTEGQMLFDGGEALDPSVELVAVHELRSQPGETVTLRASGTLSRPIINFSSRLTSDQGEVIALLLGGDRRRVDQGLSTTADQARQEASQFLTGVAFGVLSLSLKEEFGRYVPTIVLETGSGGAGAQIRVGVDVADYIDIPERMQRVIQGIYFEGYYSGQGREAAANNAAQSQNFGFLLELRFPRNIVGTTTFSPLTQGWSVDATWEP